MFTYSYSTSRIVLSIAWLILVAGCASQSYRYEQAPQESIEQRAVTQEDGAVRVSASVPSEEEINRLFGIHLMERDIQPVWLEISNQSNRWARFAPYSLDDEYFPPHEVAYMHRKKFSKEALSDLEMRLHEMTIDRRIPPASTVSGYVFTSAESGTKAFNVDVHFIPNTIPNSHFSFFINVPGFTPDHAAVDFASLYSEKETRDLSREDLRAVLNELPCCVSDSTGLKSGRPIDVVLVGDGKDVLMALLRAGWSENSLGKDPNYLVNIEYLFERTPDALFRKVRDEGSSRNEMTFWLAPFRVEGKPVWLGHVKHAITRLFDVREYFFGARLDPNADEGRNFLLQSLWYAQSLTDFALSPSGEAVSATSPRMDVNGKPWFSDGYRVVMWISPEPVSMTAARNLGWHRTTEQRVERALP